MTEADAPSTDDLRLYLLVLRCQAGDERAFAALMDRFGARTLAYLRGLLGDDGEDVQQDVWLAVYRGVRSLANPRAFRTWLFRTTRHRAIDYLRARRRERELLADVARDVEAEAEVPNGGVPNGGMPNDDVPNGDMPNGDMPNDPAVDAGARLRAGALARAMAALAPIHREVLLLRHRDDLSYAEIALVVGCSIGTVRSRLHHARLRLHALLAHGGDAT